MVKGMKQTEIGWIPEDWDYGVFSNFVTLRHGFQFLEHHFSLTGIPVIKIGTLKDSGGIDVNKFTYVPAQIFEKFKSIQLFKGDVVMALTGATLGKVSKVDYEDRCLQNYRVGLFNGKDDINNNFIYHILQSFLVQKTVKELVNSGAQPNLGKADFDKITIPVPSLPEQETIAGALSDADAWIESLEQLIAKKRLIKQGAMQELLTPKEGWEVKKLGEVCAILNNLRIPIKESSRVKGDTPYYGANGIQGYIDGFTHFGEFVLVAEDGANDLSNYPVNFVSGKIWVNNHAHVLQGITSIIGTRFLSYLLKSIDFQNVLVGGTRAKLNKSILEKIELKFPSLTEQTRIATILSDMDVELEALEQQLHKARQIKQGMMQELLTGRVRLVMKKFNQLM